MIEGTASRTALSPTIIRAIESLASEDRRVCYDPLAAEFLGDSRRESYRMVRGNRLLTKLWLWTLRIDPAGTKAEAVARTRYIDDYLEECISHALQQVVILGAGYDSRAYRFKALERLAVFEVDHPDTQRVKIANVKRVLGHLPSWVSYVPVDFEKEDFGDKLFQAGYKRDLKTVFIWEGVTMYISAEAVDSTLAFVAANSGTGSSIIFNYYYKSYVEGTSPLKWVKRELRSYRRMGEPLRFGIESDDIQAFLMARGFSQVRNATPAFLTGLYFKGSNARRKVCPLSGIAYATLGEPQSNIPVSSIDTPLQQPGAGPLTTGETGR